MATRSMDCVLCRSTTVPKIRRLLHSPYSVHIVSILSEFVAELSPPSVNTVLHCDARLCRPCARTLEKLNTLRQQLSIALTMSLSAYIVDLHYMYRPISRTYVRTHLYLRSACCHVLNTPIFVVIQSDWRRQDLGVVHKNPAIVTRRFPVKRLATRD